MQERALCFESRAALREWLAQNAGQPEGVWLLFSKKGGPKTVTAAQALEEALCFGWIDGQMQSLDGTSYRKYFAPRRAKSVWSAKNRQLAARLEADGLMTERGRAAIEAAKQAGCWEGPARITPTQADVDALAERLRPYPAAHANFLAMTPSAQKAYTGSSLDVKTPEASEKRLALLVERLTLNLNPMESLAKKRAAMQAEENNAQ